MVVLNALDDARAGGLRGARRALRVVDKVARNGAGDGGGGGGVTRAPLGAGHNARATCAGNAACALT